ncbi:three-helix bundle dimerization domain-containing protein [Streptomyces sp. NPDC048659]|uniref:three-helix bundle dimerization domain-containing protein n=1 Tax=Streptomyces sp. NPDC048659 TaxID=3155489 RepID=UPI0034199E77
MTVDERSPDTDPGPDESFSVPSLATRLAASYPSLDAAVVEAAVAGAYGHFAGARVTAYLPILVERRSRRTLDVAARAGEGGGGSSDGGPEGEGGPGGSGAGAGGP